MCVCVCVCWGGGWAFFLSKFNSGRDEGISGNNNVTGNTTRILVPEDTNLLHRLSHLLRLHWGGGGGSVIPEQWRDHLTVWEAIIIVSPESDISYCSSSSCQAEGSLACSDITNTLVGITGETVPEGGNLCIY